MSRFNADAALLNRPETVESAISRINESAVASRADIGVMSLILNQQFNRLRILDEVLLSQTEYEILKKAAACLTITQTDFFPENYYVTGEITAAFYREHENKFKFKGACIRDIDEDARQYQCEFTGKMVSFVVPQGEERRELPAKVFLSQYNIENLLSQKDSIADLLHLQSNKEKTSRVEAISQSFKRGKKVVSDDEIAPVSQSSKKTTTATPAQSTNRTISSAASSTPTQQAPVSPGSDEANTIFLELTAYNKHTVQFKKPITTPDSSTVMSSIVMFQSKSGIKKYDGGLAVSAILSEFEKKYRAIQESRSIFAKIASVFSRDALTRASDPRPWYKRLFSTAPEKKSEEKMAYLLGHAEKNPESNTAVALRNVLDARVQDDDAEAHKAALEAHKAAASKEELKAAEEAAAKADADFIRSVEQTSELALNNQEGGYVKFNNAPERLVFEEKQARDSIIESEFKVFQAEAAKLVQQVAAAAASRKVDSPTPSVGGSATSSDALPVAADSEPVSPISVQGRQQRSGSQDSGISALMSSARSGSFPPSPDGSSRRATPAHDKESNLRLLRSLESEIYHPLLDSLPAEIVLMKVFITTGPKSKSLFIPFSEIKNFKDQQKVMICQKLDEARSKFMKSQQGAKDVAHLVVDFRKAFQCVTDLKQVETYDGIITLLHQKKLESDKVVSTPDTASSTRF